MRARHAARGAAGGLAACAFSLLAAGCQQTVMFLSSTDGGDGPSMNPGDLCPNGQRTIGLPVPGWDSPRVIVALDRSLAMSTTSFGPTSELVAAQDALEGVVAKYEAVVRFSYTEFPRDDFNCTQNSCCAAQVMSIPDSNDFHNATHFCDAGGPGCPMSAERPIRAALSSCKDFFMPFGQGGGKRYVLLVTDGEPSALCTSGSGTGSCPDEAGIVSQLASNHVETAVVALAFPDDACLGQLGATGRGTSPPFPSPPFYGSASSADDLATTLDAVVGTMAADACTLDLSNFPGNLNDVIVFLDGTIVQQGAGWQFTDSSHIKLSGTACQSFVDHPANLSLVGCTNQH
jgi:hypothetical protein